MLAAAYEKEMLSSRGIGKWCEVGFIVDKN
jgi:hypothetical protein